MAVLQPCSRMSCLPKMIRGIIIPHYCRLAQLVEQLTVNQLVVGSSPTAAATVLGSEVFQIWKAFLLFPGN